MKIKYITILSLMIFLSPVNAGTQINSTTAGATFDNIGYGYETLDSLTSGALNTAIGFQALKANTSAGYNTAIGYHIENTLAAFANTHDAQIVR